MEMTSFIQIVFIIKHQVGSVNFSAKLVHAKSQNQEYDRQSQKPL